jgi:hypothetical protein
VDDPWERALPTGLSEMAAYDPVAGRLVSLEDGAASRAAHARWRGEREAAWRALFPSASARLVAAADENLPDALVRFFSRK